MFFLLPKQLQSIILLWYLIKCKLLVNMGDHSLLDSLSHFCPHVLLLRAIRNLWVKICYGSFCAVVTCVLFIRQVLHCTLGNFPLGEQYYLVWSVSPPLRYNLRSGESNHILLQCLYYRAYRLFVSWLKNSTLKDCIT